MRLFVSDSHDVFANLAFEESLMREEGESAFLWVNDPCVVIGRNQNPYYEADVAYLDAHGIALARRLTGGGAVYHDAGNLCYSIVTDDPRADEAAEWALSALEYLGVQAEMSGRNDIMVGQAKVGGLAERFDGRCLKHGTLLVSVDLSALENALCPSPLKLGKHGIASVGSRVTNLSDSVVDLSMERVMDAFAHVLGAPMQRAPMGPSVLERATELRSPDWIFAPSAEGDVEVETVIQGDLYRFSLVVKQGVVESVDIATDACNPPDLDTLAKQIVGRPPGRVIGDGRDNLMPTG